MPKRAPAQHARAHVGVVSPLSLGTLGAVGLLPRLVCFACLLCLSLGFALTARAAPFDPDGQDWEGLSELVRTVESEVGTPRSIVTSVLDLGALRREDGLLLIHPTRSLDADELSAFMRAGGRLALLDDYGTGDALLAKFGIQRIPLPASPAETLRANPALAIAEPASIHPTVRDVGKVVTNHAVGLEHAGLSPLLVVRGGRGQADALVGLAGAVGQGRLIAIGDGSIVINSMLRYPGNLALTKALARYLVEDDVWGKRGGKVYVLANGFETVGTFGDSTPIGGAIGELRHAVLDTLERLRHEGLPPPLAYFAALALGLGVAAWASLNVGRTHAPTLPRFVRPIPVVMQGGIAGHAAVLGSPDTSRELAVLELKSELEEQLATRLGLDRAPPRAELVARVREAGWLDAVEMRALAQLLDDLHAIEARFAGLVPRGAASDRVSDRKVLALAERVHRVVAAVGATGARGRVGFAP